MKKTIFILLFVSVFLKNAGQEDLSVLNFWTYNGDWSNVLFQSIRFNATEQMKARWTYVGGLTTRSDWEKRQATIKRLMAEIVGEFPAKTPLNPVITGTVKKEGYTVEKLYFESRPGFYVTAALFLPTAKKGKMPAILYCSGHYQNAFRSPSYQKTILNLVKKGFVVLAFDPIGQGERLEYFGADGTVDASIGAVDQHTFPGLQSFITGLSPVQYFIWDGIRAVDYLISRKEVDPARIGITGQSGGGTQTAYIAAMDERIVAAAPECYITTFDKLFRSFGTGDPEQNMMYAIKKGIDQSDLLAVRAPKPALIVATTRDIASIQGTRDVYHENKKAYAVLGFPDNLQLSEDDAVHECTTKNRESIVAFFQKHLNHPGDPKEMEVELLNDLELRITPTGLVQKSLKGETLFSLNIKKTDETLKKRESDKPKDADFSHDIALKAKSLIGYNDPALSQESIFSGRLWRNACAIEKYLIKGTGHYYIPVLRLTTNNTHGKTVLLLDDRGKASAASKDGLAEQLALQGYQVIVPDLSGYGELSRPKNDIGFSIQDVPLYIWCAGLLTHKSPLAVRVEEIKRVTDFIKTLDGSGALTGLAFGTLTPVLLHAAVINNDFNQLALVDPLYAYESIVRERDYRMKFVMSTPDGVIGKYDLPDLIAALSPVKILMINPVNALDKPVDKAVFDHTYSDVKNKYGDSPHWTVVLNEQDVYFRLLQWLK